MCVYIHIYTYIYLCTYKLNFSVCLGQRAACKRQFSLAPYGSWSSNSGCQAGQAGPPHTEPSHRPSLVYLNTGLLLILFFSFKL